MAATAIDYAPKTKIRLGGFLGKKYGKHHHFLLERGDAKKPPKRWMLTILALPATWLKQRVGDCASLSSRMARTLVKMTWIEAAHGSCGLSPSFTAASGAVYCRLFLV